jgi:hypothetical protein
MLSNILAIVTAFVAVASLIVTVVGWYSTYSKQKNLESLKGDIQKLVSEHDVRFTHFHKRRVEVNEEIYKRVVKIIGPLTSSVRGASFEFEISPEEYRSQAFTQLFELIDFYHENRLYLDHNICEQMEKFIQSVMSISIDFGAITNPQQFMSGLNPESADQRMRLWKNAADIIKNDLPAIRDHIENQMQVILGIGNSRKD